MAITQIPPYTSLSDGQFIQIEGPDSITTGYSYDAQQRALYFKESQILFPSFHGVTHIAEDPVPSATCDTPGLMSADDKCKLDAILQTRIGVAGFMGAGFPDDGGWMQGDVILAAGTEFISLERIGNVVRFTVDSPIPLNCACFAEGAPILMADGTTRPIEKIRKGDLVVTHDRQIKEVKTKFLNNYKGKVYSFKADNHRKYEFKATHNHPFYVVKAKDVECIKDKSQKCRHNTYRCENCEFKAKDRTQPRWVNADQIEIGDFICSVYSSNNTSPIQKIRVADWVSNIREENDQAALEYTNQYGNVQLTSATKIRAEIDLTPNLLWLLGAYLAEGNTRNNNIVVFSVGDHEFGPEKFGTKIQEVILSELGLDSSVVTNSETNGSQITICSSILARLLDSLFGRGVAGKRIPKFLMELDQEQQKNLLRGLFAGDAHRHKKQNRLVLELASKQLINQTAGLLQRLGNNPSVVGNINRITKAGTKCEEWTCTVQSSDAQWLDESMGFGDIEKTISREIRLDEHVLHRITGIEVEEYEGEVHNFEVEDVHTYVVGHMACHNCEECTQIYWVADETDIASIRPPSCGGKLPGVNGYGEFKIYLFPESTIADPNNVTPTLNNKGNYPALIFKRYDDALVPGTAEYELILKRDSINSLQTEIGWAFTPGATGSVECVWFTGKDTDGNQTRFELKPSSEPNLLGALLYKGHLITKKMGVIIDYTSTVLSTNQYSVKEWDVNTAKALGDSFTAKNVWQYLNPENPTSGANPSSLVLDGTIDLLPIGTLVDIWWFKVGEVSGEPIRRYYFSKKPNLNPNNIWTWVGQIQFGDVDIARDEIAPGATSGDIDASVQVSSIRQTERNLWGITGFDDPLISYELAETFGTEAGDVSVQHRAVIDTDLPGMTVVAATVAPTNFSERPIWLWNRKNICNALVRADIGRPDSSSFVPYDFVIRAPIDEHTNKYMKVIAEGQLHDGANFIRVSGVHFHDLPPFGTLRALSPSTNQNKLYTYKSKLVFPSADNNTIALISGTANSPYSGDVGDIVELLHQEYNSPVVRVEFSFNESTELVEVQFKVGTLDMALPYENNESDDVDDYVRGLASGYAVSAVYSQAGTYTGVGTQPDASPDGFVVYDGGAQVGGTLNEYWNRLEIMLRDGQVWIWWNQLLIPPSTTLSAALATPVSVTTPYFPITYDQYRPFGKCGARLWPGASIRRFDVRTQITNYSEFVYGQLEIS